MYSTLKEKPDFILKPAREWDMLGHNDYSINRCPTSSDEERRPLLFTRWKLGHLTPGEENDCSGAHWILEDNLAAILAKLPTPSSIPTVRHRSKTPPSECAGSSHRTELRMAIQFQDEVADNRDRAVEYAEIGSHGDEAITHAFCTSMQMSGERHTVVEIDTEVCNLQTELARQMDSHRLATKRCSHGVSSIDRDSKADSESDDTVAATSDGAQPQKKKSARIQIFV